MDSFLRPTWHNKTLTSQEFAEIVVRARAERHKAIMAFWGSVFVGPAALGRRLFGNQPKNAAQSSRIDRAVIGHSRV